MVKFLDLIAVISGPKPCVEQASRWHVGRIKPLRSDYLLGEGAFALALTQYALDQSA